MKGEAFRRWLDAAYASRTAGSRASEAMRVEQAYGDLDEHYRRDRFEALLTEMAYSRTDASMGSPNATRIVIAGDIYNGLASLRSALRCYRRFADHYLGGQP